MARIGELNGVREGGTPITFEEKMRSQEVRCLSWMAESAGRNTLDRDATNSRSSSSNQHHHKSIVTYCLVLESSWSINTTEESSEEIWNITAAIGRHQDELHPIIVVPIFNTSAFSTSKSLRTTHPTRIASTIGSIEDIWFLLSIRASYVALASQRTFELRCWTLGQTRYKEIHAPVAKL